MQMSVCMLSHVQLFVTSWTVAHQTPLFMGFSWQEYWNGLPFPPPGDPPNPGIEPASPALAGGFFTTSAIWEAPVVFGKHLMTAAQTSKAVLRTGATSLMLHSQLPSQCVYSETYHTNNKYVCINKMICL